ncbi:MAG: DUF4123 domain-containing protein [Gammaproteobacteria bacterium]|nr:DUF4123 domain-containing protein [Gammaproteobacteria bacterium]
MSQLKSVLFDTTPVNVFAVLDGASIPGLLDRLFQFRPRHVCLLRGKLTPDMAEVAPYLIALDAQNGFTEWVLKHAKQKNWGIFFRSVLNEKQLRRNLRELLRAELPDGRQVMFRFYDPRTLNVYLPSCTTPELETFFKDVYDIVLEDDENKVTRRFHLANGSLLQEVLH